MALLSRYLAEKRFAMISPYINGDVLDVGCQEGQLKQKAGTPIKSYTGIDVSEEAIARARTAHPDASFQVFDIDKAPLPFTDAFDTIILSALIEHVFNLRTLGEGLAQALRSGGRIVLTTPTPFGNDFIHRIGSGLGLFSKAAVEDHIVIFNKKRCDIFAREFGLRVKEHRLFQFGCNQLAVLEKPPLLGSGKPDAVFQSPRIT